jgi:hypothetical protein
MCYRRSFSAAGDLHLRGFLFEIFCYLFTLTAFSHSRGLSLDLASMIFRSPFIQGRPYQGILLGRCRDLFFIIFRVAALTQHLTRTAPLDALIQTELLDIESRLTAQPSLAPPPSTSSAPGGEDIASELYRLACLLHVRNLLSASREAPAPANHDLVEQFTRHLATLPVSSPVNGILCWPLVIAGLSAVVSPHRRMIAGRLRANHATWRTDILTRSADFLRHTWNEEKAGREARGGARGTETGKPWGFPVAAPILEIPVLLL